MTNTSGAHESLQALRAERKFTAEGFYSGAADESTRVRCEGRVNRLLDDLAALLTHGAPRDALLARASQTLAEFDDEDTEDRERADDYVGAAMRAVGINDWTDFI